MAKPLHGVCVLSLAVNVPGPVAAARLRDLGADVVAVLPPGGDPLELLSPRWYADLHREQTVLTLDLKTPEHLQRLHDLLEETDVLITSHRPSALKRLRVDFPTLQAQHPRLCQVDIVGAPRAAAEVAGHDLTYQAEAGLVQPPAMPVSLFSDLAGAERAVTEALAALIERAETGLGSRREVALSEAAEAMALPALHGITAPGGTLGGGFPAYAVYAARDGYVALAALEPHFQRRTAEALGVELTAEALSGVFAGRTVAQWRRWAAKYDIPLAPVPGPLADGRGPRLPAGRIPQQVR